MKLVALLVCCVVCVRGQFQLSFGTPSPAPAAGSFDPNCKDQLDNCYAFPKSNCLAPYDQWAKDYCPNYCGYCIGPTTPAPPCVDVLPNCAAYGQDACTSSDYRTWANKNCRRTCRLCPPDVLARLDAITTTIAPADCVDKLDCRLYGTAACTKQYEDWSKDNCVNYCGYCQGLPTAPPLCTDKIPNCAQYDSDTCTNPDYKMWAEDNCRKFCKFCTSSQTISFVPPSPPSPGKRSERRKRQFVASHHHHGSVLHDCWDSKTGRLIDDPYCKTPAPSTLQPPTQGVNTATAGSFLGDNLKPHNTPAKDWDSKPSTTVQTTTTTEKPKVTTKTTEMPTTTTTEPPTTPETMETTTTTPMPMTTVTDETTTVTLMPESTTQAPVEETTTVGLAVKTPPPRTESTAGSGTTGPTGVTPIVTVPVSKTQPSSATTAQPQPSSATTAQPIVTDIGTQTVPVGGGSSSTGSTSTTTTQAPSTISMKVPHIRQSTTSSSTASSTSTSVRLPTTSFPVPTTEIPTTSSTTLPPTTTDGCFNKIDNCHLYPKDKACKEQVYRAWAMDKCAAYCEFCTPVTLTPVPCVNKIPNCKEFDSGNLCTETSYAIWAEENCYAYCGFGPCGNGTAVETTKAPTTTTTVPSTTTEDTSNCTDVLDNCDYYTDDKCTNPIYKPWAMAHCARRCGYCQAPAVCVDANKDCDKYPSEICTLESYRGWARENCRKFCNLCTVPTHDTPTAQTDSTGSTPAPATPNVPVKSPEPSLMPTARKSVQGSSS